MSNSFATYITKEDFKRAFNGCFKKAWVWHHVDNFKKMLDWQTQQELIYYDKEKINNASDFNHDGTTIDLIEVYQTASETEQQQFLHQFETPEGFSYEPFLGETLADGLAVGEKAKILFTLRGKTERPQASILDLTSASFSEALVKTKRRLSRLVTDYSYGFELAFSYDQERLKIRPDVLKFKPNNHVDIIEIKATSKAKPEHFFDLAYQIYVLEKNGLIVDNAYLGHLNPDFIWGWQPPYLNLSEAANQCYQDAPRISFAEAKRNFEARSPLPPTPELYIDECLEDLFVIDEVYKKTRAKEIVTYITAYRELNDNDYLDDLLKRLTNQLALPFSQIRPLLETDRCKFRHQYKATKKARFWIQMEPEPFCYHILPWFDLTKESIFNFTGASNFTNHHKAMVYRQTHQVYLEDISNLKQLEDQLVDCKKPLFLEPHYRHFEVYKQYLANPHTFDAVIGVKRPLTWLAGNLKHYQRYPLFMYDFETAKWAIPRFPKTKTYQQIPFQYSLDVLLDNKFDYHQPQTMPHYDFLASQQTDPRPAFIESFLSAVLKYGPGKYVAYNDAFEKTILKHLAFLYPEYRIPLFFVVQNTIDLMTFFKGKKDQWPWFEVYHPEFHGSYSIKKTQPALDPNFSYQDLTINKGDQASQVFRQFIDGYLPLELWSTKIYPDLLRYCNRDTLAMVVILQRITELYQKGKQIYDQV